METQQDTAAKKATSLVYWCEEDRMSRQQAADETGESHQNIARLLLILDLYPMLI